MNDFSKPRISKILYSGLIDLLCFSILALIFNFIVFNTPISNNFKNQYDNIITTQEQYKLTTGYGEKVYLTSSNETAFVDYKQHEDSEGVYIVKDLDTISAEIKVEYVLLLNNDNVYQKALLQYQVTSVLILIAIVGTAQGLIFLLVPLLNEKRATPGKLLFGLKTINYQTKQVITWPFLVIQFLTILIIESIIPYLLFGEMMLIFIPLILFAVVLFNKEHRTFHHLLANVANVDTKNGEEGVVVDAE